MRSRIHVWRELVRQPMDQDSGEFRAEHHWLSRTRACPGTTKLLEPISYAFNFDVSRIMTVRYFALRIWLTAAALRHRAGAAGHLVRPDSRRPLRSLGDAGDPAHVNTRDLRLIRERLQRRHLLHVRHAMAQHPRAECRCAIARQRQPQSRQAGPARRLRPLRDGTEVSRAEVDRAEKSLAGRVVHARGSSRCRSSRGWASRRRANRSAGSISTTSSRASTALSSPSTSLSQSDARREQRLSLLLSDSGTIPRRVSRRRSRAL